MLQQPHFDKTSPRAMYQLSPSHFWACSVSHSYLSDGWKNLWWFTHWFQESINERSEDKATSNQLWNIPEAWGAHLQRQRQISMLDSRFKGGLAGDCDQMWGRKPTPIWFALFSKPCCCLQAASLFLLWASVRRNCFSPGIKLSAPHNKCGRVEQKHDQWGNEALGSNEKKENIRDLSLTVRTLWWRSPFVLYAWPSFTWSTTLF